jgi:hypothetical protein
MPVLPGVEKVCKIMDFNGYVNQVEVTVERRTTAITDLNTII